MFLLWGDKGDAEAPHSGIIDMEPCDKCKQLQSEGIMFVLKEDAVLMIAPKHDVSKRFMYLTESQYVSTGLKEAIEEDDDENTK